MKRACAYWVNAITEDDSKVIIRLLRFDNLEQMELIYDKNYPTFVDNQGRKVNVIAKIADKDIKDKKRASILIGGLPTFEYTKGEEEPVSLESVLNYASDSVLPIEKYDIFILEEVPLEIQIGWITERDNEM